MDLSGLVRYGTVMDVDDKKLRARVKFQSEDSYSSWLYVLQHSGADIYVKPDAEHTHRITDTYSSGGSADTYPAHDHPGTHVAQWMPKVNDRVLCLYIPTDDVRGSDGFILGAIGR